jgi:hypothetical protein
LTRIEAIQKDKCGSNLDLAGIIAQQVGFVGTAAQEATRTSRAAVPKRPGLVEREPFASTERSAVIL